MDVNNLQVNTNIVGGYFSSEQIDLLSIIRCNTKEELVSFVNNCIQINDQLKSEDLYAMIEKEGLEIAKKEVFKAYQNSLAFHDAPLEVIIENSLNHLGIEENDVENIMKGISNLSLREAIGYINKYINTWIY